MIDWFKGQYFFLSNFYEGHIVDGYPSNEARYQSKKTLNPRLREVFKRLSAADAKTIGRSIIVRSDWDLVKDDEMMEGLLLKFESGTALAGLLIKTADQQLVEGNYWHDNYWGDCYCKKCEDKTPQNKLGIMLMAVRDRLNGGN